MIKQQFLFFLITIAGSLFIQACAQNTQEQVVPGVVIPKEVTETFTDRMERGIVEDTLINEASGLVASQNNAQTLWTHNDSGDDARLFLIGMKDGSNQGEFQLEGIQNRDWEDIALGVDPRDGKNYVYVAEIGDNEAKYDTKYIYRFPEPTISSNTPMREVIPKEQIETITFQYPDGARDAEALLIDENGDIYVISKREAEVGIYRASYPVSTSETITLKKLGTLPVTSVVAGDVSSAGVLLKTYTDIYLWEKTAAGVSIEELLTQNSPVKLPYTREVQGESIAWDTDGKGYFTLSEEAFGQEAVLYFYQKK